MRVERKMSMLPWQVLVFFSAALALQIITTWTASQKQQASYVVLSPPQSKLSYRLSSLGSVFLAAHLLSLKLQLHDNQKGRHINYKNIPYPLLSQWLITLQAMNTTSEYSALLATRVFSNTRDKKQLKQILETVIKLFEVNPLKNWRWMAEGAVIAKYNLNDLNLALTMAKAIAKQPRKGVIPAWARDLEFIILEELNMLEAATYIVEQNLKDQSAMHPDEKRFLKQRLSVLKQKTVENSTK